MLPAKIWQILLQILCFQSQYYRVEYYNQKHTQNLNVQQSELIFKTYLTIAKNQIQKDKQLEEDEVLFKAIEEEKTHIKAKYKNSANFGSIKLNTKLKREAFKRKKEFVKHSKYKKYGYKDLLGQV